MPNAMFINSFSFRSVNLTKSHHANFVSGLNHNYITHLINGTAKLVCEEKNITLNPGDMAFIPRGLKYHSHWYGNPEISFNAYSFLNFPDNLSPVFNLQKLETTPEIIKSLSEVPLDNTMDFYSVGKFFLFLDLVYKQIKKSCSDNDQKLLKKAMDYIILHPDSDVPVIAKHCFISETKLYELFKLTNTTPSKFKMSVKLEKAVNLLVSTDKKIEDISQICGFSSTSYFRKNFFKAYAMTPKEIRNSRTI